MKVCLSCLGGFILELSNGDCYRIIESSVDHSLVVFTVKDEESGESPTLIVDDKPTGITNTSIHFCKADVENYKPNMA